MLTELARAGVVKSTRVLHVLTNFRLPEGTVVDESAPVLIMERKRGRVPTQEEFYRLRPKILRDLKTMTEQLRTVDQEPLRRYLPANTPTNVWEFARYLIAERRKVFRQFAAAGMRGKFRDLGIVSDDVADPYAVLEPLIPLLVPEDLWPGHGDWIPDNMLIADDELQVVLDWELGLFAPESYNWAILHYRGVPGYVPSSLGGPNMWFWLLVCHIARTVDDASRQVPGGRDTTYLASLVVLHMLHGRNPRGPRKWCAGLPAAYPGSISEPNRKSPC